MTISLTFAACSTLQTPPVLEIDKVEGEEAVGVKDKIIIPLTKLNTIDPLKNNNITYYNFSKLIYEGLFEFDENLEISPLLAESYTIEDEGKTIVVRLKDDIYWHNGDKLTSEDIVYTIEMIKELDDASIYRGMFESALEVFKSSYIKNRINTHIVDEKTVKIYFDEIYSNNLEALTFPLVNKESYSEVGKEFIPIGTGPYKFQSYKSSTSIDLLKNESYWRSEPIINKIVGRIFQDEEEILKAFEDGRSDFAFITGVALEEYRKNTDYRALEYTNGEYEFLGYNFKNNLLKGDRGREVRKAIYYGIDRQEIVEKVFLGHATQVDIPLHPNSYLSDEGINLYGHYANRAKAILSENGFEQSDSDGILKDSRGSRLSFRLITNSSNIQRMEAAQIIKDNLKEIGVEIILEYPEVNPDLSGEEQLDEEWRSLVNTLESGDYDIALLGWDLSIIPDLTFMFHSDPKFRETNIIAYKDEMMDSILEESYRARRRDKQEKYKDLQSYIIEEIPYSSLYFKNDALLVKDYIKGKMSPQFFNLYRNIEKYEIEEALE